MRVTVAVVIPTYNRAHCVSEAIESVLAQTVPADEVIVVDDGSTDTTPEVLAGFGDRIIVIRQPNRGVSAARNAGIARATSEWITFLDSDDVWYPNRVFVLHRDVVKSECGVHVANFEVTGEGYHRNVFQLNKLAAPEGSAITYSDGVAVSRRVFMPMSLAVRRDLLIDARGFDEEISFAEDLDLA
ncbi:MAG: glycosyltransferase, partial [Rhodospirillales bacterium]|nr:glycosyltransferase [Rhodospirillales bacterium]